MEDMSEDEALGNKDLVDSEKEGEDEDYSEDDADLESEEGGEQGLFVNPLNKRKEGEKEESEEWSSDGDEQVDVADDGKADRKQKSLLGKRKRGGVGDMEDFFKNEEIEEVPADDVGTRR